MPQHLAAYSESQSAGASLDQLNALADAQLLERNNNFIFRRDTQLQWGWIGGANLTRARIVAPSFRPITNPEIRPFDQSLLPPDDPAIFNLMRNPLRLPQDEEIQIETSNNLGTGSEQTTFLLSLLIGSRRPMPAGDVFIWRATSTDAATANTWTNVGLTFDNDLPRGRWAIVGFEYQATNAFAARIIFDGEFFRPGVLAITGLGNRPHPIMVDGSLGMLGEFDAFRPPEVEVLNNSTDADHEFFFRIMRIG